MSSSAKFDERAVISPGTARDRATSISAVIARIAVGLLWLDNLTWKTPPNFGSDDNSGLYFFTSEAVRYPVFTPYTSIVENVILPNFGPFAWGVFLIEICLAVFLLLGFATRFWALVGVAQAFVIFLSVGAAPNEWKWSYFLMMVSLLAVFGFAAGRVWGIDGMLRKRVASRPGGRLSRLYLLAS